MISRLLAVIAVLTLAACATTPKTVAVQPPTILVSLDGFRPDYLDRGVTPVLSTLAADGVRGAMRPSFPSKTFPNHYTLVTGLRPDRHGVVDNTMEDPAISGVTFKMSDRAAVTDARWWAAAEPIWVTAEKAGIVTAPMFWPGSEAPIRGVRPTFQTLYDETTPAEARVDRVLAWLDLPLERRPRFITLYFHHVDTAGHRFGPQSPQVNEAAALVDAALGRLVDGLKARGLTANLVIVADHGMAPLAPDRRVFLDDLVKPDAVRFLTAGAYMTVYPQPGREAEAEAALIGRHPHVECWRKADIPARFRYGRNPRVAPVLCLAETGWSFTTRSYTPKNPELGNHGFDPESPDMAAVFIAHGPAFRRNVRLPTFDNVDVYPLLARLIGVRPMPGDGRLKDVAGALAP